MSVSLRATLALSTVSLMQAGCSDVFEPYRPLATGDHASLAAAECGVKDWNYTSEYAVFDGFADGPRFFFTLKPLPTEVTRTSTGGYMYDTEDRANDVVDCLSQSFAKQGVRAQFGSLPTGGGGTHFENIDLDDVQIH